MPSSSPQNSDEPSGLLKTLGAVFSLVLFGSFLSKLKTPPQQSMNSISPNTEASDENDSGRDLQPLSAQLPPSAPAKDNSYRCCHHKTPLLKIVLDVGTFLMAVRAVIAASIYAGISYKMWGEMQQQTCIQKDAAMNAERAWVGLVGNPQVEVSSLKEKRFTAQITFALKNFGKGPAFNVSSLSNFATHGHVSDIIATTCNFIFPGVGLKPTRPVYPSGEIYKLQRGQILYPDQPPFAFGTDTSGESSTVLGQEVFVVGCIAYKDQFSNPHWAKFSFSTGPLTTDVVRDPSSFKHLYISSANNYTDDAEKKPSCPVTASPE